MIIYYFINHVCIDFIKIGIMIEMRLMTISGFSGIPCNTIIFCFIVNLLSYHVIISFYCFPKDICQVIVIIREI